MTEVKLYKSALKGSKLFVLTILCVIIGIWMITSESPGTTMYILGWLGTCLFGLGIPIGLFHLFDRRPQIIITENGIWDRTTSQDEVRWEQIQGAYTLHLHGQTFISLVVDDTFHFRKKPYAWAAAINDHVGAQQLNLNLGQLHIDENQLLAFLKEMTETKKENRRTIMEKYSGKNKST